MTELELARVSETTDLSGGVVVYDKSRVIVVAKKIVTCEQCGELDSFLFILHKDTKARIGAIMDLYDDVQIYIKPNYRGKGYASLVMQEVVPYWMPHLVSITSTFEYQDKKIEYLAKCGQMILRPRHFSGDDYMDLCAQMDVRKRKMLETSAYAKALQEMNIAALAACTDKVINPRCLTKDYPSKDIIFLSALHGLNSINCEEGLVYLPLTQFSALDCKVDSVEQLYQKLRRLCHITVARENDNICLEFSPYDSIMMYWDENKKFTEMLSFCFLRINHDNVYICLMSPFQNAEKWFHRYVKSPKNLAEDIYECQYSWGMIELEGDYIEITFNRANMTTEIKKTISKHALELLFP